MLSSALEGLGPELFWGCSCLASCHSTDRCSHSFISLVCAWTQHTFRLGQEHWSLWRQSDAPVGHHRRASDTSRAFLLWGPTDFSFSEWSGGEGTRVSLDPAHMELSRKREGEERPTRVKSGETERCEDRFRASKITGIKGTILSWWLYGIESGRRVQELFRDHRSLWRGEGQL